MPARVRQLGLVLTPVIALAVVAVGLRLAATTPNVAAIVRGAPPAGPSLAWQIFTGVDDEGDGAAPRELAMHGVTVVARSGGAEATWRGDTNEDGIAELNLALPKLKPGDAVSLTVTATGEDRALATGDAKWEGHHTEPLRSIPYRPWGARDGDIGLDVEVPARKISTVSTSSIWVRATEHMSRGPIAGVAIDVAPTLAMEVTSPHVTTDAQGWAEVSVHATASGAGISLAAHDDQGRRGSWSGLLPVDPIAAEVTMPPRLDPGVPASIDVVLQTKRPVGYAQIESPAGRVYASTLALVQGRAEIAMPKLDEGVYWLVLSQDASRGATLRGATIYPFFVAVNDARAVALGPNVEGCIDGVELLPCLASVEPRPTPLWVALDGFAARRAEDQATRARARRIALVALFLASLVEAFLIVLSFLDARRSVRAARIAAPELARARGQNPVLFLVVSLALAVLGFGLLGALLVR